MPTETKFLGLYGAIWLAILLVVASALFAMRVVQLIRVLTLGRKENRLDHLGQRLLMFLREVMGQSRMIKGESIINWAHPLIFWGFCFFLIASGLMFVGGILAPWLWIPQAEQIPIIGTFVDLFAVAVLIGLIASSIRRYILTPPGLQRTLDATIVVLLIAALMITYLLAEAGGKTREEMLAAQGAAAHHGWGQTWLPAGQALATGLHAIGLGSQTIVQIGVVSWWIHASILLLFLVYLPYSKHMHLIWAPFAVFLAELPYTESLPPAEYGEQKAEATENPLSRFTWRMLMNAYTCAECGRCERVCPAASSGAALSPRQVVHDLKHCVLADGLAALKDRPPKENGEKLIGDIIKSGALWGCATCRACVDICPVRNEHVSLIIEMRRKLVEDGVVDASLMETLVSLQRYGNSQSKSARKRHDWAKDLPVPVKDAQKEPVETLWFLGDYAAFHPSAVRISRMVAQVFHAAGLDFGTLGNAEQSAGNDVRRVGEEGLFEMLAEKNVKALSKADFQRIVTTDPHTYHALKHDYPRFGLERPVFHYTEILDELLAAGKLPLKHQLPSRCTYHDPCYLGRYNGVYDAPRRIIEAVGMKLVEMPRNRENSFCCGAGGGKIWMQDEEGVSERPADLRLKEVLQLEGVTDIVVACPKDLVMFEDAVKTIASTPPLCVVDVGELVFEAMGLSSQLKEQKA
ncbi:MAG: (Fe-S)-binding protein [Pirellulales bacterium]|nr:(Fe-S)-binding protein [Pirellulales bacterium]